MKYGKMLENFPTIFLSIDEKFNLGFQISKLNPLIHKRAEIIEKQ